MEQIEQRLLVLKEALRRAEDQMLAVRGGIAELELLRESLAAATVLPPLPRDTEGTVMMSPPPEWETAGARSLDGASLLREG